MTVFNARALGTLVTVAGNALSKRLTVILNALVKEQEGFTGEEDSELPEAIDEAIRALLSSISDPEGLNTLMLHLLGWCVILILPSLPSVANGLVGSSRRHQDGVSVAATFSLRSAKHPSSRTPYTELIGSVLSSPFWTTDSQKFTRLHGLHSNPLSNHFRRTS